MQKNEFAILVAALKEAYPRTKMMETQEGFKQWYEMLKDIPYKVMAAVVYTWISTQDRAPAISQLREQAANITQGKIPDWSEKYKEVVRLIHSYGYMRVEEAYEKMDELTRETVKRIGGFEYLCKSSIENEVADRANFRDTYNNLTKREEEDRMIPLPLKRFYEGVLNGEMGASSRDRQIEQKD